jgi:hypothetical protein
VKTTAEEYEILDMDELMELLYSRRSCDASGILVGRAWAYMETIGILDRLEYQPL